MERWFRFTEVDGKENRTRVGRAIVDSQAIEVFEGASIFEPGMSSGRTVSTNEVQLLAPVVPSKFMALWNKFRPNPFTSKRLRTVLLTRAPLSGNLFHITGKWSTRAS
jgi:hypothetical protein